MRAPHETLPTLSLFPVEAGSYRSPVPMMMTTTTPPVTATPQAVVKTISSGGGSGEFRALDEESRKRILDYIYDHCDGRVTGDRNRKEETDLKRGTDGHALSFFIPSLAKKEKAGPDILDVMADKLRLTTKNNLLRVDKALLIEHGVTVRILIEQCQVKIGHLFFAKILTSFQDLMDVGFTTDDLKRDRMLFDCQALSAHCGVTWDTLERHQLTLNIVKEPHFYAQELIILKYPLGQHIDQGYVSRDTLLSLNYAMCDLVEMGFAQRHLKKLKISRELALQPHPNGFGWSPQDINLLS